MNRDRKIREVERHGKLAQGKHEYLKFLKGEPITRREDNRLEFYSGCDIPISVWNRYMKKFGDTYRIFRDEIGEWGIRCKFGRIMPYSLVWKQLCFYGNFRSSKHKTYFLKKLLKNDRYTGKIMQEGEVEIVITFPEEEINSIADCLLPMRKKKISDERRRELSELMSRINEGKWAGDVFTVNDNLGSIKNAKKLTI